MGYVYDYDSALAIFDSNINKISMFTVEITNKYHGRNYKVGGSYVVGSSSSDAVGVVEYKLHLPSFVFEDGFDCSDYYDSLSYSLFFPMTYTASAWKTNYNGVSSPSQSAAVIRKTDTNNPFCSVLFPSGTSKTYGNLYTLSFPITNLIDKDCSFSFASRCTSSATYSDYFSGFEEVLCQSLSISVKESEKESFVNMYMDYLNSLENDPYADLHSSPEVPSFEDISDNNDENVSGNSEGSPDSSGDPEELGSVVLVSPRLDSALIKDLSVSDGLLLIVLIVLLFELLIKFVKEIFSL